MQALDRLDLKFPKVEGKALKELGKAKKALKGESDK